MHYLANNKQHLIYTGMHNTLDELSYTLFSLYSNNYWYRVWNSRTKYSYRKSQLKGCLSWYNVSAESVFFFFFNFSFSFAYTTSPAAVMKLVVFFRSSKPPYNFWWSGVADGHCAIRSGWCLLHLWRCSFVWSSSPQGLVGGRNDFKFPVHECVEPVVAGTQSSQNHLAGPVKKVVCTLLLSWFLMMVVFSWYWMLVDGCSSSAPHLVSWSACSFASNTDTASVRKTVGEHGSKQSLTKIDASVSAL